MNDLACQVDLQKDTRFVQDTLYVLSGKWKLPILIALYNGHGHYRSLAQAVPGITFRMLSRESKTLAENKLIERTEQAGLPWQVDYQLTAYCQSLYPLLAGMIEWAKQHRKVIR